MILRRLEGLKIAFTMDTRDLELRELRVLLADYQRLKDENAELRRLFVENGITIPGNRTMTRHLQRNRMRRALAPMRAQAKTQRSPYSEACSEGGEDVYASRTFSGHDSPGWLVRGILT